MGGNPSINELVRIGSTTTSVTAGETSTVDVGIPAGEAVLIAWGHGTGSADNSRVSVQLVADNAHDRQLIEVAEQGGNNAADVSITAYKPR